MNRKFIVSGLMGLGILAGMVALFPALWVVLLALLLVLVAAQVVLVRRHLHIIGRAGDGAAGRGLLRASAVPQNRAAPGPAESPAPAAAAPEAAGEARTLPVDESVFSRFREQLESAERRTPPETTPEPTPPAAPDSPDDVQDSVQLGSARRPAAGTPAPAAPAHGAASSAAAPTPTLPSHPRLSLTVDETDEEAEDLFADLVPQTVAPPAPAAPREGAAPADTVLQRSPPAADELQGALQQGTDGKDLAAETAALVKLAEDALDKEDPDAARAALTQAFSLADGLADGAPWRLHRAAARAAAQAGEAATALSHVEAMLKAGYVPEEAAVPALVERVLEGLEGELRAGTEVSVLMRLLAHFRQAKDRPAMDRLYVLIEAAQERVGDERKLLQYLKNHLEIRKVMGDREGQLELIDQIGNRCYKLGLTAEAQQYYELGLKLRNTPAEGAEAATEAGEDPEEPPEAEAALAGNTRSGRTAG